MIKRVAVCILCVLMALSVCVAAESIQTEQSADTGTEQQAMPQNGGRPGGGRGGMGGMQPPDGERPQMPADGEMPQRPGDGMPPMSENGEIPQQSATEEPATTETEKTQGDNDTTAAAPQTSGNGKTPADEGFEMPQGGMGGRGGFEGMMRPGQNTPETESTPMTFAGFLKEYQTPIISVILLALAFVFVIFYKKKRY